MDANALNAALVYQFALELSERRAGSYTGTVTVTVRMNQGGVTNAEVSSSRRMVSLQAKPNQPLPLP